MKAAKLTYILPLLLPVMAGCSDSDFFEGEGADLPLTSETVAFMATVGSPGLSTRRAEGDGNLFEPLEMEGDPATPTLYLHTSEIPEIGYDPSRPVAGEETRGNQIESAAALETYHTNFMVHADMRADGSEYIEWAKTRPVSSGNAVWRTERSRYWAGEKMLTFQALSPASEFGNLRNLGVDDGVISFSYTARKGEADRDAEAQADLMAAVSACNKPGSQNGLAPLKFHHALSAVKFAVRDVLGGEVVNVKISGIASSGDCVYRADDDSQNGVFTWSGHSGRETYSQNFNYAVADRVVDPADDTQDIVLNDRMPEKTFMVIPQLIPDDAEIIVTLKRTGVTPEQITVRGKIKANNVQEWKPGHEYLYTISTSKDNWVYVLKATGNHNSATGKHNVDGNQIYVYSPSVNEHDTYGDDAYFKVTSYRYRANNPRHTEPLPWKATHGGTKQYQVTSPGKYQYVSGRDLTAAQWITPADGLSGVGSTTPVKHNLTFAAHHVITDWPGDKTMQDYSPYSGNGKTTPWDLSTCGGKKTRNTANSYIVDREGWYFLPFVYGNAYKNGADNPNAYKFTGPKATIPASKRDDYKYLDAFVNHAGAAITKPEISATYCKSVGIVWSDVYNAVSDLSVMTHDGQKGVRFRVNKYNIQQGSVIIALYDGENATGNVVWSWQIWLTEHWLNPSNGQPHALNTGAATFNFTANATSGRRERGDLQVSNTAIGNAKYYVSPYNLGWCDPKNVDYLYRPGEMTFVQYRADGTTATGLTAALPIIQNGARIEYKYGNNTYYQFGRKDAIVGFVDHNNTVKRNFGPKQYKLGKQNVSIATSIKNPQTLYCLGNSSGLIKDNDWCSWSYVNLWNNSTQTASKMDFADNLNVNSSHIFYSLKTVYDPCPPGYMVPPGGMWKIVGTSTAGSYIDITFKDKNLNKFNGTQLDPYSFKLRPNATKNDANSIWLTSTGHRWYTQYTPGFTAGQNFNPNLVYLWSSTPTGRTDLTGFGLALGKDTGGYGVCAFFYGRRAMARPVRPIRESYTRP